MKFKTRILTTLLAVLMIFGTLSMLLTITVGAAKEEVDEMKTEEGIAKYYLQTNKFKAPRKSSQP